MNNAKHTPGPWVEIAGSIGHEYAGLVAMVPTGSDLKPRNEADARMICAAPDLFASLELDAARGALNHLGEA